MRCVHDSFLALVVGCAWTLTACGLGGAGSSATDSAADSAATPMSSIDVVRRTFTAAELDIPVDPQGRPYDSGSLLYGADRVDREPVASLVIPDGELRVMDGNHIEVDPAFFGDEATVVDFDTEELVADVVWERFDDRGASTVLALVLSVPDATVERWQPLEFAYGTDGGLGGVTSQAVIEVAETLPDDDVDLFIDDYDFEAQVSHFDLDGQPGTDTIVFANGFGDGGFPMSRGLDTSGRLVALAITDTRYPWRLAFPEGTPPLDITQREDEIAECLAGERDVEVQGDWHWCTSDL